MDAAAVEARLTLARQIALQAGQIALEYVGGGPLDVERKADDSPVTVADRRAEQHLRQRICESFGDDGILGEEFGPQAGCSGYRWILDPIDGTKSFISGVPLWGTLIGVEHEEQSVLGVVYIAGLDEGIYAAAGQGAWHFRGTGQAVRAQVSRKRRLADGLFCTSEVKTFLKTGRQAAYERLQDAAWLTRTWGDCYGYLLVATGRAELMVDPAMHVWDCAALKPILEEAGGTFTDWRGRPTIHAGEAIATNGLVLDEVLELLGEPA